MEETAAVLTVFFEEQTRFWVGVYERREDGSLAAAKVIFGAEPKTQEIHTFLLANWNRLRFGKTAEPVCFRQRKNPKRMQREARRQTGGQGVGTKA